jgi:hypothetical protein
LNIALLSPRVVPSKRAGKLAPGMLVGKLLMS